METKKWLEIVLMPLVIIIVGAVSTHFITKMQIKSAEEISNAQMLSAEEKTKSDREIKLLEIYNKHILSSNANEQQLALNVWHPSK